MASYKKAKRAAKKFHPITLVAMALALAIGAFSGYFFCGERIKNDTFELIGQKETVLHIGDEFVYRDEGVRVIENGKDLSSSVKVTTDIRKNTAGEYVLDTSEEGVYTIFYTVEGSDFYKDIKRIRIFRVIEAE